MSTKPPIHLEPTPALQLVRQLKERRPDCVRTIVAELTLRIEARQRAKQEAA